MSKPTAAVAIALMLCTSAASHAAKVAGVAVTADRRTETDAAAATVALMRLLRNDARVEAVDLDAKARGSSTAAMEKKLEDGRALLAEALNALDEMKGKIAADKAKKALEAIAASDLSAGIDPLLDALAARAMAFQSENDKVKARGEIAKLLVIRPDYKFDPRRVTPGFTKLIDEAKAKGKALKAMSLEVKSSVSAGVWVDGVFRGATPLEVKSLTAGHHYVTVKAVGYQLAQQDATVGLGTPVDLTLAPAPEENGLLALLQALKTSAPFGGPAASAVAAWAGADEVIAAGLEIRADGRWVVLTRVASGGTVVATIEKALPQVEAVQDLARDLLERKAGPPPVLPPPPPVVGDSKPPTRAIDAIAVGDKPPPPLKPTVGAQVEAETPKKSKTLAFVAAGGAVAALGGAVVLGLLAKGKADDAHKTPAIDQAGYDSAASSSRSMALGANILYGVAAIGAGLAVWQFVASSGGDSAPPADKRQEKHDDLSLDLAPLQGGGAVVLGGRF